MKTTSVTMTGRERMNRMLERREQDRIPRHETFWPETLDRWQSEGLTGGEMAALEILDGDIRSLCWSEPKPFPGRCEMIAEDADTVVSIGCYGETQRRWKNRSGTPEHIAFGCTSREQWETVYLPKMIKAGSAIDPDLARRDYRRAFETGKWSFMCGLDPFEGSRKVMGDEITMMAMVEDPQWIRHFSQHYTSLVLQDFQTVLDMDIQPDGIWLYGDMAYNHATMCSPQMYKTLIWPDHKRIADFAHENGMKMIFHTDGNVNNVIDLYIEAGFDCLQPLEAKANLDIRRLCPKYGEQLSFFGNIDIMVMMTNDREKIEEEIRSKLAAGMATQGYAYHSDHSVPPQVSWETFLFIIELLGRYGNY